MAHKDAPDDIPMVTDEGHEADTLHTTPFPGVLKRSRPELGVGRYNAPPNNDKSKFRSP